MTSTTQVEGYLPYPGRTLKRKKATQPPVDDHRTTFILNLLKANTPEAIAQVASLVPITKCPPAKDRIYSDRDILLRLVDLPSPWEKRKAIRVGQRPSHARAGWSLQDNPRLEEIKVGRTVRQMLNRGVLNKDIRQAIRDGWLTLSEIK